MTAYKIMGIRFLLLLTLLLTTSRCQDECVQGGNCSIEPNEGPCLANFTRYYYDKTEKKCKSFTWGGCNGVVPFETLTACEQSCGCQ